MSTFLVFIISLILIIFLFLIKGFEIYYNKKLFLENFFLRCDFWFQSLLLKIRYFWKHINLKNFRLLSSWFILSLSKMIISVKRHFDHKQSTFFIKKNYSIPKNKNSVSFFLKDVSDYKKKLREKNKNKRFDIV